MFIVFQFFFILVANLFDIFLRIESATIIKKKNNNKKKCLYTGPLRLHEKFNTPFFIPSEYEFNPLAGGQASRRAAYWPVDLRGIRKTFNKFITDIVYGKACVFVEMVE